MRVLLWRVVVRDRGLVANPVSCLSTCCSPCASACCPTPLHRAGHAHLWRTPYHAHACPRLPHSLQVDLIPLTATNRDHLTQYAWLDLGLDPWPYAGTTTTCEAMYMGGCAGR